MKALATRRSIFHDSGEAIGESGVSRFYIGGHGTPLTLGGP